METTQRSSMHSGIVPCLRFVYTPTFHGLRRPALGMLTAGHPITDRKTGNDTAVFNAQRHCSILQQDSLKSSEVVMMGRQSGSWTATSYEGLPRNDLVAKIKPDTLDNLYCVSIYTPQRTYWIMFDSSAKSAMLKK